MFILKIAEALVLDQESCHNQVENPDDPKRSISSLVTPPVKINSDKPVKSITENLSPDAALEEDGETVPQLRPLCQPDASSSTSSPNSGVTMNTPCSSGSPMSVEGFPTLPRISPPTGVLQPTRKASRPTGGSTISSLPRFSEPFPPALPHQGLLYSLLVGDDAKESQRQSPLRRISSLLEDSLASNGVNGDKNCPKKPLDTACRKSTAELDSLTASPRRELRDTMFGSTGQARGKTGQHTYRHRNTPHSFGKLPHIRSNKRLQAPNVGVSSDFYMTLKTRLLRRRQSESVKNGTEADRLKSFGAQNSGQFSRSRHHSNLSISLDQETVRLSSDHLYPHSTGQLSLSAPVRLTQTSHPLGPISSCCALPSVSCSHESGLNGALFHCPVSTPSACETGTESRSSGTPEARTPESPTEFVQLAKKTARPVQARVTEWLRQVAEFVAVSAPLVSTMTTHLEYHETSVPAHEKQPADENTGDRQTGFRPSFTGIHPPTMVMDMWLELLIKCWHRLLALHMAENSLDLVVVDHRWSNEPAGDRMAAESSNLSQLSLPWSLLPDMQKFGITAVQSLSRRPDRKFADNFARFLLKIKQASLTAQEFFLLRNVVLMTAHEPEAIASVGLNVICVSRSSSRVGQSTELIKKMAMRATSPLRPSGEDSCQTLQNASKEVAELSHLTEGLHLLSSLCPYRITNLFCTHLYTGSSPLNNQFLLSLHSRFLVACQDTLK